MIFTAFQQYFSHGKMIINYLCSETTFIVEKAFQSGVILTFYWPDIHTYIQKGIIISKINTDDSGNMISFVK